MLAVTRLTLNDFRCYSHMRLECDVRPLVLTGPNGAGKTNILEALSFLAPGRGLRRARISEAARTGSETTPAWAVAARIERPDSTSVEIGTGRDGATERRLVKIDGLPARTQSALSEAVSVLWLTPAMDRLFTEGASGRRRFLDRLVLGLDRTHAARAGAYEHAMRERARLLKEGCFDPAWLGALEEKMAAHGTAMTRARIETVERLNAACHAGTGPFPAASLALAGTLEQALKDEEDAESWFRLGLAKTRRRDAEAGGTQVGPHRSDLLVRHASRNMPAGQCSTGEQKAVLVSIMLAQARVQAENGGLPPILLLDEIAAHLDEIRRNSLFDELAAMRAQSWLTGTDEALFAPLGERGQFFHVNDARVEPASEA